MSEDTQETNNGYVALAADIVSAYVSNNSVPIAELPKLLTETHAALTKIASGASVSTAAVEKQAPAVNPKKSVSHDFLICLEDGKKYRSLKRHLRSTYGMTPEEYRAKWGLPADYPMVAPGYAQARSELAKSMGLGRKAGETRAAKAPANDEAAAPKTRGRRKAAA
jgi:predicted transcriptional regulator